MIVPIQHVRTKDLQDKMQELPSYHQELIQEHTVRSKLIGQAC